MDLAMGYVKKAVIFLKKGTATFGSAGGDRHRESSAFKRLASLPSAGEGRRNFLFFQEHYYSVYNTQFRSISILTINQLSLIED